MGFREDEYKMNVFLKLRAQDYIRNPGDETMANLLAEFVVRIEDECEALVPLTVARDGLHFDTVSDGQDEWIPMYTDWDEITKEQPARHTMSLPIRNIVEDAFRSRETEGIIINLHSEEVFIGKPELDWILYTLAQEAC